jgi:hypothetical protein
MSVLLLIIIAALVVYVIYQIFFSRASSVKDKPTTRSDRGFAFLSNGSLFYRERGGDLQQLHSQYVQEVLERREQLRERHNWKEGTSFNIAAGGGSRSYVTSSDPIPVTSAAFNNEGNLLYFLKNESVGGLFCRERASGKELRLLLRQNLELKDLNPSPNGTFLAASSQHEGGVANIALLASDGNSYREVTGGDTADSAPAWIPGVPDRLLFQSSGVGRNQSGYIVAYGPASIQKLDMEKGSVTPILDDPKYDHLKPRVTQSGDLLFIRRPYHAMQYGTVSMINDALLFPFRLLRALFHYLNFFSMMYSRKPLTSANGPAVQADIKNILLQGRRVDVERAMRNSHSIQGVPSLVPDSWQLISRNQQGVEHMLASNVASFDISSDGSIVFSNGRGIFMISQDGSSHLAGTNDFIGEVVASVV